MNKTIAIVTAASICLFSGLTVPSLAAGQCGGASWYALTSKTASGVRMNPNSMTAAHKSLPFGTKVRVVDQSTGKAVTVTINDRGPYAKGRIIDLSKAAATQLGFKGKGHTKVCIQQV